MNNNNIEFELIGYNPLSINTNFEEFKKDLEEEIAKYKGVAVTEENPYSLVISNAVSDTLAFETFSFGGISNLPA